MQKRTIMGDDGGVQHVFEYGDTDEIPYSRVEIRHQPDNPEILTVHAHEDDSIVFQDAFKVRDLSFDPISVMGRGESKKLLGTSPVDDHVKTDRLDETEVPREINTVFNSLGMTIVPQGEWWLDGN